MSDQQPLSAEEERRFRESHAECQPNGTDRLHEDVHRLLATLDAAREVCKSLAERDAGIDPERLARALVTVDGTDWPIDHAQQVVAEYARLSTAAAKEPSDG